MDILGIILEKVYNTNDDSLFKIGSWVLSNLCKGRPLAKFDLVKDSFPFFSKALDKLIDDFESLKDIFWALSVLSGSNLQ